MYAIELDTNYYLKASGDAWAYVVKQAATLFASLNDANAYMLDNEIKFMTPSAKVVKL